MGLVGAVVQRTLMLLIGSFCCVLVLLKLAFDCLRKGPKTVLVGKRRDEPPACLVDPSLGTHGYLHLEDIRVHYVSNGAEDKPLMLLVHGFPEFWYSWRHELREFKDDYRVVAVDMRGYNETDQPSDTSSYTTPHFVNDLKQIISALGYSKCVLVGHDWGGVQCWRFVELYPEMVSKFIALNAPNGYGYMKNAKKSFKQILMSWYVFFFQIPWAPELWASSSDYAFLSRTFKGKEEGVRSGLMTDEDVEAYKYAFSRNGLTGPINFYRAAFSAESIRNRNQVLEESKRRGITVPVLLIWGTEDKMLGIDIAKHSCEICKNKFTIKYVEGASHFLQMDRPDLVHQYMREFLEE